MEKIKLLDIVLKKLHDYFTKFDMVKKKEGVYIKNIDNDILAWIGPNRAVRNKGNYIEINAVIGVRHQKLEELVADLCEEKYHKYLPSTISTPIGYLTPKNTYAPMVFTPDTSVDDVINEFSKDFEKYALDMFEKNKNLKEVCNNLQKKFFLHPEQSEYRIAVCYYLLKEYDKAKEYVNQQLEKLIAKKSRSIVYMNTFAKNFFTLLQKESK